MREAAPIGPGLRRLEALALVAVWLVLGSRLVASAWRHGALTTAESPILYHAATIGYGYADAGFLRRGLGGTIAAALPGGHLAGTAWFHLLSALALALVLAAWVGRLKSAPANRLCYALVAAALFGRWGEDAGRTDLAVMACIAASAWLVAGRRETAAALLVAIALAFHESAYIVGLPLVAALAILGDPRRSWRGDRGLAVVVLVAGLAVYAASARPDAFQAAEIVRVVRERLFDHVFVDWALYFALGGSRTVATSVCQNLGDPNYALHVGAGLALIAVTIALLVPPRRGPLAAAAFAALLPYAFLCIVANDMSRWAVFGMGNAWLVGAACGGRTDGGARRWWQALAALALLPLMHPKAVRIPDPIFAPSPALERLATAVGGPKTLRFESALSQCDPAWREVLAVPGPPR